MARVIFSNKPTFEEWAQEHCKERNYEAFITDLHEIILYPRRSTRPVTYGYIKLPRESADTIKDIKTFLEGLGLKVYEVDRLEWAEDRGVGIPMPD